MQREVLNPGEVFTGDRCDERVVDWGVITLGSEVIKLQITGGSSWLSETDPSDGGDGGDAGRDFLGELSSPLTRVFVDHRSRAYPKSSLGVLPPGDQRWGRTS